MVYTSFISVDSYPASKYIQEASFFQVIFLMVKIPNRFYITGYNTFEGNNMNLCLVQHAKADADDPRRPLSDIGREELKRIVDFIGGQRITTVEIVYHSGKLRAEQTSKILAEAIQPPRGVEACEGLAPMDNPSIWADRLSEMHQDIMLVGHMPHMSRIASLLLTGDSSREVIQVRNAGIICLNRDPDNIWTVEWIVTPYMLGPK
jgi:phosphohistidine phosphatase